MQLDFSLHQDLRKDQRGPNASRCSVISWNHIVDFKSYSNEADNNYMNFCLTDKSECSRTKAIVKRVALAEGAIIQILLV